MNKLLFICLLLCSSLAAAQQDSKTEEEKYDEIMMGLKALLIKIDNLENRIDRLERLVQPLTTHLSIDGIQRNNRAKLAKWRRLEVNQSMDEVIDLVGLPLEKQEISSGEVTEIWEYEFDGKISFRDDKVYRWRFPKNIRD